MKLAPFTVHRPGSVGQASRLLVDLGDDAAAYCGGTELLLAMKLGLASYEHLVDLKRVYGLRGIAADGGITRIGAATTHHEIETSAALRARYPEMSAMISQVANLRVRSVGTLGGNLCFADPHSDPASFLMAVGATLLCQRAEATRRISAAEFLTGLYETALAPGELLVAIELPARPERTGISHLRMKLTERPVVTVTALVTLAPGTALAAAGTAMAPGTALAATDTAVVQARLIVGSVASVPFAADTESLLGAGPADFGARAEACAEAAAAACTPLPDGEASPDYLSHLVRVHARQALGEAFTAAAA
jgi:carbon-monoxide dehydrogenase medium subunit